MLALEACGCSEVRKGKVTEEHVRLPGERQVTDETSEMGDSDGRVIGGGGAADLEGLEGKGGVGKLLKKKMKQPGRPSRQITSPGRR